MFFGAIVKMRTIKMLYGSRIRYLRGALFLPNFSSLHFAERRDDDDQVRDHGKRTAIFQPALGNRPGHDGEPMQHTGQEGACVILLNCCWAGFTAEIRSVVLRNDFVLDGRVIRKAPVQCSIESDFAFTYRTTPLFSWFLPCRQISLPQM